MKRIVSILLCAVLLLSLAACGASAPADADDNAPASALELLEKTGVIVVPGSAFGKHGEGYVRMALVVPPERMQEAVRRIGESGMIH